jgi:hypothetical protein
VTHTKRKLWNLGTLVLTAVLILGMAAWTGIQATGDESSRRAAGRPAGLWSIDADGDARVHPAVDLTAAETRAVRRVVGRSGLWVQSTTRTENRRRRRPERRRNSPDDWSGPS